jgi:hypothetical protein
VKARDLGASLDDFYRRVRLFKNLTLEEWRNEDMHPMWSKLQEDMRTEGDFSKFAKVQMDDIMNMLQSKGKEYNDNVEPAMYNFYEGARVTYTNPAHFLMVQATKQWLVINRYVQGRTNSDDNVRSRIMDIIIYMLLLLFMLDYFENGNGEVELE